MERSHPRVLIACAYFDWFSSYQEVSIAQALTSIADVHILSGNRVNPIFKEAQLEKLGVERTYPTGRFIERGVVVERVKVRELRSMSASLAYFKKARSREYDLVIQVMPGHILSALASWPIGNPARVVLYGDNSAMYSHLNAGLKTLKRLVFSATKGNVYRVCNFGADRAYGYTPDTLDRVKPFLSGATARLLPLSYDKKTFYFSEELREAERSSLGLRPDESLIVTAGKAKRKKRIDLLVKAFDEIAAADPKVKLLIVGAGSGVGSEDVKKSISDSKFSDRILNRPVVATSELNSIYNASDVGTWPFMPAVSIQQAMGTGIPVAIPMNNIVGHLLLDESAGSFIDPGDKTLNSLVLALNECLRLPSGPKDRLARSVNNEWLSSQELSKELLSLVV